MNDQWRKEGVEWFKAFCIGLLLFFIIRTFVFSNYVVEGKSMMPTLQDGNKLVVNKIGYDIGDFDRFDVIVFHANKEEDYVKRVIGLPGDSIQYKNDILYINGKPYKEPYLDKYKSEIIDGKLTGDFTLKEITNKDKVPPGKIFVLGDNRRDSSDSRYFGFVDESQVVGKVDLRYWPLKKWDINF
ncbi:signal peptidase I [Falsibacillus pallidus]|uniref:Signal peptidase I n=1 Tax=Falsibacillus pallidus TaxID=493781 RepID=A0A370H1B4_9BACI|nr:signal peptidase I [Falsibacillus pallidus]RDI47833.1 signal peptidase I [Falsibacillus pallidus]